MERSRGTNVTNDKKIFMPGDIPAKPGVYIYRDLFGKVIYVGKATNLRKRMSHYFQPSRDKLSDPKLRSLIKSIVDWEYQQVKNEEEALLLESRLIKEYAPRYNILMRDDKRFQMIKINLHEPFPRLKLARVRKDDQCRYFGPFPKGGALKPTMEFLAAWFGLCSCYPRIPDETHHKHCLKRIVKDCCEPCVGKVTREAYMERVEQMMRILDGSVKELVEELNQKMHTKAAEQKFELAAKLRDIVTNIETIFGVKKRSFRFAKISSPTGQDAVDDLQQALGMRSPPQIIEGFDISNISGQLAVASMVRFENGRPVPKKYRRFKIRDVHQSDDFAMMQEVIRRHYGRKLKEEQPFPDLIMVDGGKGQLSSAIETWVLMKCPPRPLIGLAKKREEIFLPGASEPLVLERHRPALRLLQALRDEAHRFAIGYHRQLRSRRITESLLDDIAGIGPKRRKKLLVEFGSVRELRKSTPEELVKRIPGIGLNMAKTIITALKK
jgi:excinuclease ABC subunit C